MGKVMSKSLQLIRPTHLCMKHQFRFIFVLSNHGIINSKWNVFIHEKKISI